MAARKKDPAKKARKVAPAKKGAKKVKAKKPVAKPNKRVVIAKARAVGKSEEPLRSVPLKSRGAGLSTAAAEFARAVDEHLEQQPKKRGVLARLLAFMGFAPSGKR